MPRRAKPTVIFRVEGLSDGIDTSMRDELGDGLVIPQPNAKVPVEQAAVIAQGHAATHAKHLSVLAKARWPGYAPKVTYVAPGRTLVKIITDKNGNQLTVTKPTPPFRRV